MNSFRRSPRPPRAPAVAVAMAFSALMLTGCAGEPSPLTQALFGFSIEPAATVTAIQPVSGSVSGSTITIIGSHLESIADVRIGGQPATIAQVSADAAVAVVPAARSFQAGVAPIAITDRDGRPVRADGLAYRYVVQTPVDKQLSYAMTYWKEYNTADYGDLNPDGGDCANFVSQTLIARGWEMNSDWHNHGAGGEWSPAWGYVPAMDGYFSENAAQLGLAKRSLDQRDAIALGDIVMLDWDDDGSLDHVQIVSAVEKAGGRIMIKMAGHNEDSDYRDLDEAITVDHPGGVGHFWSVSK